MIRVSQFFLGLVCALLTLPAFSADKDFKLSVAANELKIMSYNVENLFDAKHDAGKNDYEFLPANDPEKKNCPARKGPNYCLDTDWTSDKVELKIGQIRRVLDAQGDYPDVLVLAEVENPRVIGQLAKALGYSAFVMTDSPDKRGIDTAVLYSTKNLKKLEYLQQEVPDAMFLTRNISVVLFEVSAALGGGVLAVFPNHWPSQASPVKARIIVAKALKDFINDVRAQYKNVDFYSVVAGDFNITEEDKPNPIESVLLDSKWAYQLSSVRDLAKRAKSPMISKMPKATYYYGVENTWNEFDQFLVSDSLHDRRGLEVDALSYRINAPDFLSKTNKHGEKIPFVYNHRTADKRLAGFSDHFAIIMKLRFE